ncbi:hypothetical protein HY385_01580 [Candidatus Daviesbacteria bacterium]|nr:hypothetical protein [Candidatus Daviesbacteria bacterium]
MGEIMGKLDEIRGVLDKLEKRIALVENAFGHISIQNSFSDLDSDDWELKGEIKGERKVEYRVFDWSDPNTLERLKKHNERIAEKIRKIEGWTDCRRDDIIDLGHIEKIDKHPESERKWPHNIFA